MRKILQPGSNRGTGSLYIAVEYENGRLSITGVEGPKSDGDARGSCGQCTDFRLDSYAPGWDAASVERLRASWERWHLNDMRAGCEHQRGDAAHPAQASRTVTLYRWRQTDASRKATNAAKAAALAALARGEAFTPTPEQAAAAARPWSLTTYTPDAPEGYGPPSEGLGVSATETKALGWLTQAEHPDGMLSRPCEVCGYKYGSAWLREEIPASVLTELEAFPASPHPHPWGRRG